MMQIVIDIPEKDYKDTLNGIFAIDVVREAVKKGVPLPKGHGDLIDRSKLVSDCYELEIHDGDDWRNEYCGVSLMQIEHYADVIIPAIKENNE